MTNKNDTLLNPFGDKDYTETDKYQQQVDQHNPTLQEILQHKKEEEDEARVLTDSLNTDYLD